MGDITADSFNATLDDFLTQLAGIYPDMAKEIEAQKLVVSGMIALDKRSVATALRALVKPVEDDLNRGNLTSIAATLHKDPVFRPLNFPQRLARTRKANQEAILAYMQQLYTLTHVMELPAADLAAIEQQAVAITQMLAGAQSANEATGSGDDNVSNALGGMRGLMQLMMQSKTQQ